MILSVFLFIFFFVVYTLGVAPSSFGGDSGDIMLSYFFGGVAHPPGYPLNTALGFLLTHSLFSLVPVSFAIKTGMVSALYQALSCGLLFLLVSRVSKSKIIGIVASLTLGFSTLYWVYAHVAEVFQLTNLLVLVSLNFLLSWQMNLSKKRSNRKLFLSFAFLGLAAFHHQTALLLVPAYIYLLFAHRKTLFKGKLIFLLLLFSFLVGLVPYAYYLFLGASTQIYNWVDVTHGDFWRLITRADYGTFTATKDYIGFSPLFRVLQQQWYFKVLIADFTVLVIPFLVCGLIYLFRKNRQHFWFFTIAWIFTGPFFFSYASFPLGSSFLKGVSERFMLLGYPYVALFVSLGVLGVSRFVKFTIKRIRPSLKLSLSLVTFVFLVYPLALMISNFPRADLSAYKIGSIYASDILNTAEPNALLFLQGDIQTFNSQFSYYAEGVNKSVNIILPGRLGKLYYRKALMAYYPNLIYPQEFKADKFTDPATEGVPFVEENIKAHSVYIFDYLPLSPEQYYMVPEGMLIRVYKKSEKPGNDVLVARIKSSLGKLSFSYKPGDGRYIHFFEQYVYEDYRNVFNRNGRALLDLGDPKEAIIFFKKALAIDPGYVLSLFNLGIAYFDSNDCQNAQNTFEQTISVNNTYWQAYEGLAHVYEKCYNDSAKRDEYSNKAREIRDKQNSEPIN